MRRSSQVLLPMTDSLMSIPQPFSYLTRAVSVGTTLSMSCSYLTRAGLGLGLQVRAIRVRVRVAGESD